MKPESKKFDVSLVMNQNRRLVVMTVEVSGVKSAFRVGNDILMEIRDE